MCSDFIYMLIMQTYAFPMQLHILLQDLSYRKPKGLVMGIPIGSYNVVFQTCKHPPAEMRNEKCWKKVPRVGLESSGLRWRLLPMAPSEIRSQRGELSSHSLEQGWHANCSEKV